MITSKTGFALVALLVAGVELDAGQERGVGSLLRHDDVDVSQAVGPQNEVAIAIAPDDPLHLLVVAHDYRTGQKHVGAWVSLDGGRNFKGGQVPGIGIYGREGDPAVAAHRHGVFYLSYIDHGSTGNRVAVARSTDGGFTWPNVGVVMDITGVGMSEDKPYIAVDDTGGAFDGNVYVAWVRPSSGRIRLARSTDRGVTFESVLLTPTASEVTGPVPAIGPDGEVYVAWKAPSSIRFARSTDGGVTFSAPRVVASHSPLPSPLPGAAFRVSPFPTLAVDRSTGPDRGMLFIAWADQIGTGAGPDILLARSEDRGGTWSTPVRVSDDSLAAYQFFPWMCVDPVGAVHVVFHDQRDAPNSPRYHTYLARSLDGGRSFEPNLRLSDEISDVSLDPYFLGTFIGDYIGIAASPLGVYPVWTDLRPSVDTEIFLQRLRPLGP